MTLNAIIAVAVSCLVTLTVTLIFNYIVTGTKKKRELEARQYREELQQSIVDVIKVDMVRLEEKIDVIQKSQEENDDLIKAGLQAVLKTDLTHLYEKWIALGYAPINVKDDMEKMYQVYHELGANGVMDSIREEFLGLPTTKRV